MKKLAYLFPAFLSVTLCAQNNVIPTPSGDVGLGAYGAPAAKLHVQDNTSISTSWGSSRNILRLVGSCGNNFQNNHWIYRTTNLGTDWQTTSFHNGISVDGSFQTPGVDTKTWWERQPSQDVQAWGNANQTYMILNQGRLGLNWSNPAARLDVQETDNSKMSFIARSAHSVDGTTCIYASVSRDLTQAILVGQNNYGGTPNNWKGTFIVYGNGRTMITTGATDAFTVRDLSSTIKYNVQSNGQTSIGGGSPGSFMLAVNGKLGAREIRVTLQNPWPDYVFEEKYNLNNLIDVEDFIRKNKHLPNVPSAKEIEQDCEGVNIGEIQKVQMEKIEELFLYVIELKKENAAIKEELKKIQSR